MTEWKREHTMGHRDIERAIGLSCSASNYLQLGLPEQA